MGEFEAFGGHRWISVCAGMAAATLEVSFPRKRESMRPWIVSPEAEQAPRVSDWAMRKNRTLTER